MTNCGVPADDGQIDWDNLLENITDFDCSFSVDDIDNYRMSDESNSDQRGEKTPDFLMDEFFSDLLLESPDGFGSGSDPCKDSSASPDSMVVEADEGEKEEDNRGENNRTPSNEENVVDVGDGDDDPLAKKRKRQIRNKDAALRSRERKKLYVRDLELKSKYYEAECKRLGSFLQCCLAENQALRLSLHNSSKAFDVSMTKQESAVLLLESLLLGSLLGFLGIIIYLLLLTLPTWVDPSNPEKGVAPRKERSKVYKIIAFQSFMMGKTCKASRSRMKHRSYVSRVSTCGMCLLSMLS